MSFADDVDRFTAKVVANADRVFERSGELFFDSVRDGSPLTGAPGQPVGVSGSPNDGELYRSWTTSRTGDTITIASDAPYAADVEDNVNGAQFHNHGPHSAKLSVAGFATGIVPAAVAELER